MGEELRALGEQAASKCLKRRGKRDEARGEGRGDREGGAILIPEQEEAVGGLRQGVRASIYILRRVAEELVSALTRSRLLIKAGSRIKGPSGSSRNCAEVPRVEGRAVSHPIQEGDTEAGPSTVASSPRAGRLAPVHPSGSLSVYLPNSPLQSWVQGWPPLTLTNSEQLNNNTWLSVDCSDIIGDIFFFLFCHTAWHAGF